MSRSSHWPCLALVGCALASGCPSGSPGSDAGVDSGVEDAGHDGGLDAGLDGGGSDGGNSDAGSLDGGADGGMDAGVHFTLTLLPGFEGVATGNVTSTPAGIDCGSGVSCSASFLAGTSVSLVPAPGARDTVRWDGGCAGTGSCSVEMTGDLDVGATFVPYNFAFITSATIAPYRFGSVAGGDALCNAAAEDAGYSGQFMAWMSSSTAQMKDRLPAGVSGWIRADGRPVLGDLRQQWLNGKAYYLLNEDEHGGVFPLGTLVATGDSAGVVAEDCQDWTDAGAFAAAGEPYWGATFMEREYIDPCSTLEHLYCLEVDYEAPVWLSVPDGGRRAFLTDRQYTIDGGLSAWDALCTAEAADSGIEGDFGAFVVVGDAGAASRFNLDAGTWYRLDGVELWSSASLIADGGAWPESQLWLTPSGSRNYGTAWTGALNPEQTNNFTCADWSIANTSSVHIGNPLYASSQWFGYPGTDGCDNSAYLYCLEK